MYGRAGGAVAELQTVLETDWYRAESWQLLSDCLAKIDRKSEAALALAEARAYDVHLGRHYGYFRLPRRFRLHPGETRVAIPLRCD